MKDFIEKSLSNARKRKLKNFYYQYKSANDDIISMIGNVTDKMANFEITRTKADGHRCSSVPVFQMPLTDELINQIAGIAVESL